MIMLDSNGHSLRGEDKEQAVIENAWKGGRVEPYEVAREAWLSVWAQWLPRWEWKEFSSQERFLNLI